MSLVLARRFIQAIKIFGDVRKRALKDIWEQADYREFRYRVLTGDFPEECGGCECKAYLVP
jgi:MoaA/NifB/PqqE/SkfB family radical SAM enzyme